MATLKRSPRLSHTQIKEHTEAIEIELQDEAFFNEKTNTLLFQKYYRAILQEMFDSVVMIPYNTAERLSQNNNNPVQLTSEETQDQIKNKSVDEFKTINKLLVHIIKGHMLIFKMMNGDTIKGTYYESRFSFPEIVPYENKTLPVRITGLEFGINVKVKEREYEPYRGTYFIIKQVKRTIPMHEIDTIQIIPQEAGKRRTRRSKRTKQTRRRK